MPADTRPSRRQSILKVLVLIWLALQVGIPVYALAQDRPARMGWQMYTAVTELPVATVEMDDGMRQTVDVASLVARDRAEADYVPALRVALCGRLGVKVVTILVDGRREVTRCR